MSSVSDAAVSTGVYEQTTASLTYDDGYTNGHSAGYQAGQGNPSFDICQKLNVEIGRIVILGAVMAAIGFLASKYMISGIDPMQGAVLLGFTGMMVHPMANLLGFITGQVNKGVKAIRNKDLSLSENQQKIAELFLFIAPFFAAVAIACMVNPELGFEAISFKEAFIIGGVSLSIAIPILKTLDYCASHINGYMKRRQILSKLIEGQSI